jgi:cell division protein FtsI (penicillin-binding protein 3)
MLYNAVANNGKMMKPYLVNAIVKDGEIIKKFDSKVVMENICSEETLLQLKACLEGVVTEGTAKSLENDTYKIAGKTGTALVANGTRGYSDHIYQSSFAGYFPAEDPQYSCIVVIRNKPFAHKYYGALVAGPVFREIADRLYSMNTDQLAKYTPQAVPDSTLYLWSGWKNDFARVFKTMELPLKDSSGESKWAYLTNQGFEPSSREMNLRNQVMPNVRGMGMKDVLYLLENLNLKVVSRGKGKVSKQSLLAGTTFTKGQTVYLDLN